MGGSHGVDMSSYGPALIDDDTPTPEHARFRLGHLLRLVLIGEAIWTLPMGLLTLAYGWDGTLT